MKNWTRIFWIPWLYLRWNSFRLYMIGGARWYDPSLSLDVWGKVVKISAIFRMYFSFFKKLFTIHEDHKILQIRKEVALLIPVTMLILFWLPLEYIDNELWTSLHAFVVSTLLQVLHYLRKKSAQIYKTLCDRILAVFAKCVGWFLKTGLADWRAREESRHDSWCAETLLKDECLCKYLIIIWRWLRYKKRRHLFLNIVVIWLRKCFLFAYENTLRLYLSILDSVKF